MSLRKIKKFYRPNIMNVSLSAICLGLVWLLIIPLIGGISIIPCIVLDTPSRFDMCPLNPVEIMEDESISEGAYYLGFMIGDYLYGIIFLILFILVLPYTMSCFVFQMYFKYIKKIVNR